MRGKAATRRPLATPRHVSDLVRDPSNRRKHNARNIGMVVKSLQEVGAARSIVIDENNVILAGNGVTEAAGEAGITKVRVVEAKGDEIIAVRRVGLSDAQKRDLAIADNRAAELAEWDAEQFKADAASGLTFEPWFTGKELESVVGRAENAGATDPDDVPPLRRTSIKLGELFALGSHLILCGDSTNPEHVHLVMGDDKAGLMNTDPPYGIDYAAIKNGIPRSGFRNIQDRGGDIANDDLTDGAALQAFLERMIRAAIPHLTDNPAFYLWHPMLTQGTFFAAAAAAADILIHRQIIWVKPHMVLTRSGQYHWKHELCFYGWIRGKQCTWLGDKSLWEIGESQQGREHPTQKPVELFRRPIQNHCEAGSVAYEPFSGSGSQIIAGEQLNVSVRAIELEPRYVQVAIDRWEAFTGRKAQKVGDVTPGKRRAS